MAISLTTILAHYREINGPTEQKNRVLLDKAQNLTKKAWLAQGWWGEA